MVVYPPIALPTLVIYSDGPRTTPAASVASGRPSAEAA